MRVRAVPCAPLPEATAKPGDDLTRSRRLETRMALAKAGRVLSGGNVKMLADANAGDPLWAGRASVAFPTDRDRARPRPDPQTTPTPNDAQPPVPRAPVPEPPRPTPERPRARRHNGHRNARLPRLDGRSGIAARVQNHTTSRSSPRPCSRHRSSNRRSRSKANPRPCALPARRGIGRP